MGQRPHARGRPDAGSAKVTVVLELEGPLDNVLGEGSSLLRPIVDEQVAARVVSLRVDYGEASAPEHVLDDCDPDLLDLVGRGVAGGPETGFWALALRAAGMTQLARPPEKGKRR